MKKLLALLGIGAAGWWAKKRFTKPSPSDLARPHLDRPQEPVERIDRAADVPGGVRP